MHLELSSGDGHGPSRAPNEESGALLVEGLCLKALLQRALPREEAGRGPALQIVISTSGHELARRVVHKGEYLIGSDPACEIPIVAAGVEARHLRITLQEQGLLIEDVSHHSGAFISGQRVREMVRLFPNQVVQFGSASLRAQSSRGAANGQVETAGSVQEFLPVAALGGARHQVGPVVASGGMGVVLEADDESIQRTVAMKVMRYSGGPDELRRFVGEARLTGQLEHPSIVPIYELGVDEHSQPYYTMKYVRGLTLDAVLQKLRSGEPDALQTYSLSALLTIFQKVCDGVAFAHSRGVIHRDLKPQNIMLGAYGEVLVMDWGLAKVMAPARPPDAACEDRSASFESAAPAPQCSSATQAGTILGTPQFMAPEQAAGRIGELDENTDIFALGGILYTILTLQPPVTGVSLEEVLQKIRTAAIVSPLSFSRGANRLPHLPGGRVPESLSAVAMKALALRAKDRYPSVPALQNEIAAFQGGFATAAEQAGLPRQLFLLLARHKSMARAAAVAVLLLAIISAIYTNYAVHERRRAEAGEARATEALTALRRQAPALRQLAESEAGFQRFSSALETLDAALVLDPQHLPNYWRRAWLLVGMDRLPEAAEALRLARKKDPEHSELARVLPTVEKLGALPPAERWSTAGARELWYHLIKVGASGETAAISAKLRLGALEKEKLVHRRMEEWLGKNASYSVIESSGRVRADLQNLAVDTIEPLRGLPIDSLNVARTNISSLEPLRGMSLTQLDITGTKVSDLTPLRGMPLAVLRISKTNVTDLSPLRGAPLERFESGTMPVRIVDFSPLRGAPLRVVNIYANDASDLSFLQEAPLEELNAGNNRIEDLSPLRGKPLRILRLSRNRITDLSPLRSMMITELPIHENPDLEDLAPLLDLPYLEKLNVSRLGKLLEPLRRHPTLKYIAYGTEAYRPVAEFWAERDAMQAQQPSSKANSP